MKILTLHCDYINFKPKKKALKSIPELSEQDKQQKEIKECLVVLTAVESGDTDKELQESLEAIKKNSEQVNTKNLVIYPYAHLSSNLSNPKQAQEYLEKTKQELIKQGFKVESAPFGYYKEFELKVKGHPLSELSKEFGNKKTIRVDEEIEEEYEPKQLLKEIGKSILDTSKLKEHDHRIVGKQMDLYSFSDVAPGMVFWHNNGLIIYNELLKFWREQHKLGGYEEIKTPQIMDKKLWQISGHWEKYKENNFLTKYEDRNFLIKPMNCPGGMLVYKSNPKSYKDLPLRVGEIGVVHRQELSGVLSGLFRVIQMTQDDAHIFCKDKEQVESEISNIIELINIFYKKFNLEFDHVELSTRPEKRIGDDKIWDMAEQALEKVLKNRKMKYQINKGDGAFYGPKIDFHAKDSQGRTWQLSTIQLDFAMPERFELEYTDKDNKKKRPIMLHRVIYGSIERFIGILMESSKGWLPTWLAPIQVRMINFTDRNRKYTEKITEKLKKEIPNLRIDSDLESSTVQSKVKQASLKRIPYVVVVGDKEEKAKEVAVRERGNKKIQNYSIEDFISKIKKEIKERK